MTTQDYASSFIPKDTVALNLGKHTIYVYPSVTEDMSYSERSYAFMLNKSALESADILIKTRLQVFGDKMGTASLMGILQARYADHAISFMRTATNFQVLSYHGLNGRIMANAMEPNGELREINGQTNASRRPEGIQYAKISCDLKFTAINTEDTQAYPFTFFIRLYTENIEVPNSTNVLVPLNSFHGLNDWATSVDQEVIDSVWDNPKSLQKPFWLTPPAITDASADAQIEFYACERRLEDITLHAAWPFACKSVFKQTCPNFVADPAMVIQEIHQQSKKHGSEEIIKLSIAEYFKSIQTLTNFLPKSKVWPIDVVQHFITHTTPDIRQQMQSQNFVYDATQSSKTPFDQMLNLQLAFAAATLAERNLQRVRDIAQDAYTSNHAFNAKLLLSRAEGTIKKYSAKNPCWGCGKDDHVWANRDGELFCPDQADPECQKRAAAARVEFVARNKKKSKDRQATKKRTTAMSTLLDEIDPEDLRAFIAHRSPAKKPKPANSDGVCFTTFLCMPTMTPSTKPLLPISIDTHLPHFEVAIGQKESNSPFRISLAYDTCAVTNVGWSTYHLAIAKKHPQLIKSLVWAKDQYTPLTLSGVVSSDDPKSKIETTQTVLPAIIEYHMPYMSTQGSATSFKVAIGPNVAVNTIIGMSMIRAGKFSLDVEDDMIDSGVLDTTPFKVTYKPTIRSLPNSLTSSNDDSKTFATISEDTHVHSSTIQACIIEAFTAPSASTELTVARPIKTPIIVPKQKWTAKAPSVWQEDSKEPDDDDFQYIYKQQLGCSLRKRIHNLPPADPSFAYVYNGEVDGPELEKNLVLDDDTRPELRQRIKDFVIEFWDVFREAGVSIPVRGYEMVIDTGSHPPVAVRKPHYGLHEGPVMQKTIDTLLKLGHIAPDRTSPWGFRITLAPKPHQEDVTDIEAYVWRFCINYILLNKITRPAEYPIPRCDDAVMYGFGDAMFFILMDAFSGYHQVRLSPGSAIKTAFFAPHGRKYIYLVMPFGIRNAPTLFLAMMHDLKELWTEMCAEYGIVPSEDEGTTIIMDDTFLFAVSEENAFIIVRCVCLIARKYNLTWKLKKCRWFPSKVEFVGVDIHKHGNAPASSKSQMITNWKLPSSPRDIMSFIGFSIFYSRWIEFFEIKITPLRKLITEFPIDHQFSPTEFNASHELVYKEIREKLLDEPILQRANILKRFYMKTDFSSLGLGFALCQPDDSENALLAMQRENNGGECEFDITAKSELRLLPIAFGSRRTVGNEKFFHSHPGEALAATWSILKNRHFLWGRPFTLVSDCAALAWIMTYKGNNHAVVRLQLELTGYWFTVANRPGRMLEDANYFSRLGANIHIDPLLKDYLSFARQIYTKNSPETGELHQDNMPGRRRKKIKTEIEHELSANLASITFADNIELAYDPVDEEINSLYNIPLVFNTTSENQKSSRKHFSYAAETAVALKSYYWCMFQPQLGHFMQSARENSTPFEVVIAIDDDQSNRDFLQNYWKVPIIHARLNELINYYSTNPDPPAIQGYYISAPSVLYDDSASQFLELQTQCINLLSKCSNLETFILEYRDNFSNSAIAKFKTTHQQRGWKLTSHSLTSDNYSDRVSTSFNIIFAIHDKDQSSVQPFQMEIMQPPRQSNDFGAIIHEEFNSSNHSIPYIGEHFHIEHCNERKARAPSIECYLRATGIDPVDLGYQIFHKNHPAPLPSTNIGGFFGQLFGLAFEEKSKQHIRAISTSEYVACFGYDKNFNYEISDKPELLSTLRHTIPARTMNSIIDTIYVYLHQTRQTKIEANSQRFDLDLSVPALFSGIVKDELPDDFAWHQAYDTDPQCKAMRQMIDNPAKINNETLLSIDSIYRAPMRNSQIKLIENRLCYFEPVAHSTKEIKLIIVPKDLRHHVLVCFHANPLGSHFSLYYTLHRIRLRFHWPNMYSYIKKAISTCAGCILKNHSARPSSELLYSFPIDAPFMTIHADLWVPGKTNSFDGYTGLMVVMCHMTGFVAIEPIKEANAKEFARATYKVQLRYGISHLLITDPDSKFKGVFANAAKLLKIKHHMTARGNHDAVLVERFNRFLNATLRVFNNDHDTNRVFVEGALMAAYAWNSAPVAGTDLSRSLLVVGREFHFPIDFTSRQHITFQVDKQGIQSYAEDMLKLMEKSQAVYKLLIHEHRAYHRELRNAQIKNPRLFKVNDIVFARVQVQSVASRGQVKKLRYVTRGPYKVIRSYPSGSYELELLKSKATIKKHGSDLFLSPLVIRPYETLKQSDRAFGELDKKLSSNPYAVADIDGFNPSQPWAAPAAFAQIREAEFGAMNFPTVEELDTDYDSWPESGNPFSTVLESSLLGQPPRGSGQATGLKQPTNADHIGNLQSLPTAIRPASNNFADVIKNIISSQDRLFFIAHSNSNETRKEWKLVQVDFDTSMQLHPSCLQDGKFLVNFFIRHKNDDNVNLSDKRHWLEYHAANSTHTLSNRYHLLAPSAVSAKVAKSRNLVPYREWLNLRQDDCTIHGPFEFGTVNGRKTRDRISTVDWDILISAKSRYDSEPPKYTQNLIQVNWLETAHETVRDESVENRLLSFHYNLHFNDKTLATYGYTQ